MSGRRLLRPRRIGFTLVELLVVVGIIAVLISMLMPAVNRARRQARAVVCLSNLHQLGQAFQMYVNQNRGKCFVGEGNLDNNWVRVLDPYVRGGREVVFCPEAPENIGYRVDPNGSPYAGTAFHAWANCTFDHETKQFVIAVESSYGHNAWVQQLRARGGGVAWDDEVRNLYISLPAKQSDLVPLFADAANFAGFPLDTDTAPDNLVTPLPTVGTAIPATFRHMHIFCIARHGRAINVVFLDGHASRVPLPELWHLKWNAQFVPREVTLPPE